VGVELSEDNHRQLWVPAWLRPRLFGEQRVGGLSFKTTDYYVPEYERRIAMTDLKER